MTMPNRKMPPPPPANREAVQFEKVLDATYGHRAILYGPGGVGKSTLACSAPGPVVFADVDESLEKLKPQLIAQGIPVPMKLPAKDWKSLRAGLQAGGYEKVKSIVLDTWAPVEKWCIDHTLEMFKIDNKSAVSVEEYGYGKGYRYVFEVFQGLLGDLDAHVRAGRNVIIVCHDDVCKIPNPAGQDFIRWEPKMQHTDKASLRYRAKEWSDHCLFLSYDVEVQKQAGDKQGVKAGRALGSATRTLRTAELPHFMAKSRTTSDSFDIELGQFDWTQIFK